VTVRSGSTRTVDLVCEFHISEFGNGVTSGLGRVLWIFRLAKSRYNEGRWIEGGTQPLISSKAQFRSQGFVEGEERLFVVLSSCESRRLVRTSGKDPLCKRSKQR
jgi:hypothetical protein